MTAAPRAMCSVCERPASVCWCAHLAKIETATRVIILQHPREQDVAIGTARMASLCLPDAELHVGVDWSGSAALARALSDPSRPAALLYPGEGARDVRDVRGPITLVVVDGTWWQAKKLVAKNPLLAALPRVAFVPPQPSEYRIRKEPRPECVSTIEALVHALGALEGDPDRFLALLAPFRAMVDTQIAYAKTVGNGRVRRARAPKPQRPRVPAILRERAADLVCVYTEANAWPYRTRERAEHPDEIVHWVARRLATGESFDVVAAPRHPLAPGTTHHTGLSARALAAGGSMAELLARWREFVRDGDVLCSWGRYGTALFVESGGHVPEARVDLRQVARSVARDKVGTLEDVYASLGSPETRVAGAGRAGVRLAQIVAIAERLRGLEKA